jgi:hypothetical protein
MYPSKPMAYEIAAMMASCASLPMFLLGSLMLHSTSVMSNGIRMCWWVMFTMQLIGIIVYVYILRHDIGYLIDRFV